MALGRGRSTWPLFQRHLRRDRSICWPLNQIFTACAPYLARQRCRWKRHLWDHGARIPSATVGGRGAVQRAGREDERGGLSRFGPQRCVIPYSCFGVYLSVLELATEGNLSKKSKSFSWAPRASFYR